jgi:hypothetical protein
MKLLEIYKELLLRIWEVPTPDLSPKISYPCNCYISKYLQQLKIRHGRIHFIFNSSYITDQLFDNMQPKHLVKRRYTIHVLG